MIWFINLKKDSVVYNKKIIERLESALSDQFIIRDYVVNSYLKFFDFLENSVYSLIGPYKNRQDGQYVLHKIRDYYLIEDTGYITLIPDVKPYDSSVIQKRVDQIEYIHNEYPDMNMYFYYVTQVYDLPWFNSYLDTTIPDQYHLFYPIGLNSYY